MVMGGDEIVGGRGRSWGGHEEIMWEIMGDRGEIMERPWEIMGDLGRSWWYVRARLHVSARAHVRV